MTEHINSQNIQLSSRNALYKNLEGDLVMTVGRDSSVGRANLYGAVIRIPVGARFFAHIQTGPGAKTMS